MYLIWSETRRGEKEKKVARGCPKCIKRHEEKYMMRRGEGKDEDGDHLWPEKERIHESVHLIQGVQ